MTDSRPSSPELHRNLFALRQVKSNALGCLVAHLYAPLSGLAAFLTPAEPHSKFGIGQLIRLICDIFTVHLIVWNHSHQ